MSAAGLRVVHTIPDIEEEASGPSYSVVRLCQSLIARGADATLIAAHRAAIASPPPFLRTFPVGWGPSRLRRSPAMRRWLDSQAARGAIDIVHNHSIWMMPNVYPGQVARRHALALVVSPHGTLSEWAMNSGSPLKRVFWPLVQRPALAAARCFHATAESEYLDVRRMGFRQPVAIVHNGIDIPEPAPGLPSGPPTLLFLGRAHPVKGIETLLLAWQRVQRRFPQWRLRIVAADNGGYLPRMQRLARDLGLERAEFCGPLYGRDKLAAYRSADLYVLPSYSENFAVTVAEALASGTPAIVAKGAPWAELERRRAGWWIDIGVAPLAAALSAVLIRPREELAEMGRRGREWMAMEYSWDLAAERMAQTYRWLLRGREVPPWVRTA